MAGESPIKRITECEKKKKKKKNMLGEKSNSNK